MEVGYSLSSEEHAPGDLVRHARGAEEAGFGFALISDHFHRPRRTSVERGVRSKEDRRRSR